MKDCRSKDLSCFNCGKVGHLAASCRQRRSLPARGGARPRNSRYLDYEEDEVAEYEEEDDFGVYTLRPRMKDDPITTVVQIEGKEVTMEVDTGSAISTMQVERFEKLFPHLSHFRKGDITLLTASGEEIRPHSYHEVQVEGKTGVKSLRLYLMDLPRFPTLLGRRWMKALQLNVMSTCHAVHLQDTRSDKERIDELLTKYRGTSTSGIGKLPDSFAVQVHFKEYPKPFFVKARPVPYSVRQKAEDTINDWVDQGILEPIMQNEWTHPVVYREKPDATVVFAQILKLGSIARRNSITTRSHESTRYSTN